MFKIVDVISTIFFLLDDLIKTVKKR